MTEDEIEGAVALLAAARRENKPITALNATPASIAVALAIQDRVAAALGEPIGGFKANAPPNEPAIRGAIYARAILSSPAKVAPALLPGLEVEGEIAFRFTRDLPARQMPYSRRKVAQAAYALPAIEIVSGRLQDWRGRPALEQLADCLNNGGLVTGTPLPDWQGLDLHNLPVQAWLNGETVWQGQGGHPIGDPLGVAVAFVNLQARAAGVKSGQVVTTGSCTGIRALHAGDHFAVEFAGLGRAELFVEAR